MILAMEARIKALNAALESIDHSFCPMAVAFPWVQAGLDRARKLLEGKIP